MPKYAEGPEDFLTLAQLHEMTGLEFMQKLVAGELPTTTLARSLNYQITTAEPGRIELHGTPGHEQTNAFGGVHGGWYGALLDTCMTCAVVTRLARGQTQTTLEFKVNLIGAIRPGTEVVAIGLAEHVGRSTGVARGEIRGVADGRLYATGSTTCFVMGTPRS